MFCTSRQTSLGLYQKKDDSSNACGRSGGGDMEVLLEKPEGLRLHGNTSLG